MTQPFHGNPGEAWRAGASISGPGDAGFRGEPGVVSEFGAWISRDARGCVEEDYRVGGLGWVRVLCIGDEAVDRGGKRAMQKVWKFRGSFE